MSADRGKYAEGKVREALKELSVQADTIFMRLPDAHAHSFVATVADYMVVCRGRTSFVEVKSLAHDFRVPVKNFSVDQRARMALWNTAGANLIVAVYHTESKLWRFPPFSEFISDVPSWDLSAHPTYSTKVLKNVLGSLI